MLWGFRFKMMMTIQLMSIMSVMSASKNTDSIRVFVSESLDVRAFFNKKNDDFLGDFLSDDLNVRFLVHPKNDGFFGLMLWGFCLKDMLVKAKSNKSLLIAPVHSSRPRPLVRVEGLSRLSRGPKAWATETANNSKIPILYRHFRDRAGATVRDRLALVNRLLCATRG